VTVDSKAAWDAFCERLKQAGDVVMRDASPDDPYDRAEGFRYLSRLARLALEKYVEFADPLAPRFYRLSHETAKIGIDNPDSAYLNAALQGDQHYRIRGRLGSEAFLSFGTYYGHYGQPGRSGCGGYLEREDLDVSADGRFEIVISADEHSGNWLPMDPETHMIVVRRNYLDRENEVLTELEIERLGDGGPPGRLAPEALAQGLELASAYVRGTAGTFADWIESWVPHRNELRPLPEEVKQGAHGDPSLFFYVGYWELAADDALLIEVMPPVCEYWNFQITNWWLESLDYRYRPVHLNKHSADYGADGSLRIAVSARDPRVPGLNWIDTESHERGGMAVRWGKAESHPQPRCRVVPLATLLTS